ncbi:uncharacterized protein C1orf115-like [Stegastes partitus]|uniref:Uncharacterized protein C1orf115-like n=1 Tax=Stegastes partitus TaxID=144197 RepID=A0A9Y4NM14_9TELE|nr:PREDICTED: uncharacterized protein C1orf115-like [Stegastes partitus]
MKPKAIASRLFNRNSKVADSLNVQAAKYQQHVDLITGDHPERSDQTSQGDGSCRQKKCHKEVHFAFLKENYEPLIEDEARVRAKEEKKQKKKENYEKVKKNFGQALRYTWKCLMLGLHNFALGYSTPITVAAAFGPDFHQDRDRR